MEGGTGRDPAVQPAVEPLGADLAGEIDHERLSHRHHAGRLGDDDRVADVVDRIEGEPSIVIDEVVEPTRAHREAGDNGACDDACGHQIRDRLRDDIGVDRQVVPVRQMSQHLVRNAAEADLERRAIVDEPSDVACDLFGHVVGRLVQILDHGRVDLDEAVDPIERNPAISPRPGHRWVDLGDDRAGRKNRGLRHVDRNPQAARAVRIRRRDLHQRYVERHPAASHQPRYVGKRQRQVLHQAGIEQCLDVPPDVEDSVPVLRRRKDRRRRSGR
jgi:hypothetical protein